MHFSVSGAEPNVLCSLSVVALNLLFPILIDGHGVFLYRFLNLDHFFLTQLSPLIKLGERKWCHGKFEFFGEGQLVPGTRRNQGIIKNIVKWQGRWCLWIRIILDAKILNQE